MIMARNEDGTYSQVGFVKDNAGIDTEYIYDKDGDIVFEKGFTRETSGTVPLTINGIGKDLKAWSITGNTVQNGTPTPENPVEVLGCGDYDSETGLYRIPVVTRGKNLLKLKEVNLTIRGVAVSVKNNSITVKGTATSNGGRTDYLSESFVLQPGTYFISGNVANSLVYCLTDMSNGKAAVAFSSTSKFTLAEKIEVAFGLNVISGVSYDATVNVMLNEGDKKLPYEPYHEPITTPIYLDSPLYKIEGYADRLSTTEEVRIVKELVLTGNENFNIDTNLRFSIYVADIKSSTSRTGRSYCSHYECLYHAEPYDDDWNNVYYQNSGTLYFHDKRFVTVTGFKEYLAAQHAAGTPVTVWYQLAKPTTETFTAPQIPTLNGTTVIDVDTAVKPTEMYTKYKSSK